MTQLSSLLKNYVGCPLAGVLKYGIFASVYAKRAILKLFFEVTKLIFGTNISKYFKRYFSTDFSPKSPMGGVIHSLTTSYAK